MSAFGRSRRAAVWLATLLAGLAVLLGLPTHASAEPRPPGDIAAIAVYVETLPTSTGAVVAGKEPSSSGSEQLSGSIPASLPAPVVAALEEAGGEDAEALERVATSPELGAPERVVPATPNELEPERIAIPNIAVSIADGSSRFPWLIGSLALITGVAAGAAVMRRRTR